mgnify:CR=1 FL=1
MHHVWKAYHGEQDYYSENNDDALKQTWKSYYDTTDDESYQDGCVIKKKRTSMSSIAAGSTHREHSKTSSCIEFAAGDLIRNPPVRASSHDWIQPGHNNYCIRESSISQQVPRVGSVLQF